MAKKKKHISSGKEGNFEGTGEGRKEELELEQICDPVRGLRWLAGRVSQDEGQVSDVQKLV